VAKEVSSSLVGTLLLLYIAYLLINKHVIIEILVTINKITHTHIYIYISVYFDNTRLQSIILLLQKVLKLITQFSKCLT
jgi:hypothetical protein